MSWWPEQAELGQLCTRMRRCRGQRGRWTCGCWSSQGSGLFQMLSLASCVPPGTLGIRGFLFSACFVCLSVRLHGHRCILTQITEVEHWDPISQGALVPTAVHECPKQSMSWCRDRGTHRIIVLVEINISQTSLKAETNSSSCKLFVITIAS